MGIYQSARSESAMAGLLKTLSEDNEMRTPHQPASEPCLTNGYSGDCADCPDKDGCEPASNEQEEK